MRILIFFISFFPYLLFAQYESEKRDAVWLAGLSCNSETQICNNFIIDFSEENIETSSDNSSIGFAFTSAVISDKEDEIEAYVGFKDTDWGVSYISEEDVDDLALEQTDNRNKDSK